MKFAKMFHLTACLTLLAAQALPATAGTLDAAKDAQDPLRAGTVIDGSALGQGTTVLVDGSGSASSTRSGSTLARPTALDDAPKADGDKKGDDKKEAAKDKKDIDKKDGDKKDDSDKPGFLSMLAKKDATWIAGGAILGGILGIVAGGPIGGVFGAVMGGVIGLLVKKIKDELEKP